MDPIQYSQRMPSTIDAMARPLVLVVWAIPACTVSTR